MVTLEDYVVIAIAIAVLLFLLLFFRPFFFFSPFDSRNAPFHWR
jgi:ABC-type Mn2+/Zn2+ transport system permease subunit